MPYCLCRLDRLYHDDDAPSFRRDGVGMRAVHVNHDPCDRGVGIVQTHAHTTHAVGVQREALLLRVRESAWEGQDEPIGVRRGFDRRFDDTGQDDFDPDIRALALDLQLLNLGRAARALPGPIGTQEQEC